MKPIITTIYLIIMIFFGRAFSDAKLPQPSEKCTQLETELIEACLDKANASTDKTLNQIYQNIMKQLKAHEKTLLRDTQRAWLKTRSTQCDTLTDTLKIKVCYLDLTDIKVNELQEQALELMPKLFEGVWESCFKVNNSNPEPFCLTHVIIQNRDILCGEYETFVSYRTPTIQYQATVKDYKTARSNKVCITEEAHSKTNCHYEAQFQIMPFEQWASNNNLVFKLCKNNRLHLLNLEHETEKDCNFLDKKKEDGASYHPLSSTQKKELLKKPWIKSCLNFKE